MKRAIYTGRISPAQAKRSEEMQAVADGLSLLANTLIAWNTMQRQVIISRWANRRQVVEADLMSSLAQSTNAAVG